MYLYKSYSNTYATYRHNFIKNLFRVSMDKYYKEQVAITRKEAFDDLFVEFLKWDYLL